MYSMNSGMSSNPTSAGFSQPQNAMQPQSGMQSQYPMQAYGNRMASYGGNSYAHGGGVNSYAHGGRTKRGKLIMAHFNPQELDTLDHLQGKTEKCPRSGMRSYTHLEELLKNPHILGALHQNTRKHHAQGGHVTGYAHGGQVDAANGEHGDTELALIGPHTNHILSQLALPGTVKNHIDGRPQYWSLGGVLGGMWDTIKSGAAAAAPYLGSAGKAIMPYLTPAIQNAANARFGPMGGVLASGLSGLADKGFNALEGMGSDNQRAMGSTFGEGVGAAAKAYQGGASPAQSFGAGLQSAGSRFSGPMGGAMQGAGSAMQSGGGYGDIARQTAAGAYKGAGGAQSMLNSAKDLMSQYRGGAAPGQMMRNAFQGSMANSMPTRQSMENQNAFNELPFAGEYA